MPRATVLALALACSLTTAACGGDDGDGSSAEICVHTVGVGERCGGDMGDVCPMGGTAIITSYDARDVCDTAESLIECLCQPVPRFDIGYARLACDGAGGWVASTWVDVAGDGRDPRDRTVSTATLCATSFGLSMNVSDDALCDARLSIRLLRDGEVVRSGGGASLCAGPVPRASSAAGVPDCSGETTVLGVPGADGAALAYCGSARAASFDIASPMRTQSLPDELVADPGAGPIRAEAGTPRHLVFDDADPTRPMHIQLVDTGQLEPGASACNVRVLLSGAACTGAESAFSRRYTPEDARPDGQFDVAINATCDAGAWTATGASTTVAVELGADGTGACRLRGGTQSTLAAGQLIPGR